MNVLLLALLLLFPATASAEIIIQSVEIGSPLAADEYVVLKNTSSEPVDISKWSIQSKTSGSSTVQKKNFNPGALIAPEGTYIVAHSSGRFAPSANMTYTTLSLTEKGGVVGLFSNTTYATTFKDEPSLVSSFNFNSTTPETSQTTSSTPAAAETPPKAVASKPEYIGTIAEAPKKWPIQISELLPNPQSGDEFIELSNTAAEGVDVSGLWIKDASGSSYALGSRGENTVLGAYEFRLWKRATTRIALNNTDGEHVILHDQSGNLVDRALYPDDAPENSSYARLGSSWLWTSFVTPSEKNKFVSVQEPPSARAEIPAGPLNINQPFSVSAVDSTDANENSLTYLWNFGDGAFAITPTSSHTYSATGTYSISLTVTDSYNATSTVLRTIQVIAPAKNIISATALNLAAAKPKKQATAKKYFTGIVQVPPGIISRRRFIMNGRTVEFTTDRTDLPLLKRGTIIKFSGQEIFKTDRLLLQITAKDTIEITATTTAPPYTKLTGSVIKIDKSSFDIATDTLDYLILSGLRYQSGARLELNDSVELTGVLLTDDADRPTFVVPEIQNLKLIAKAEPKNELSQSTQNLILLFATTASLILIHYFLTTYGKHLSRPSLKLFSRRDDSQVQ